MTEEPELRGIVSLREKDVPEGALGSVPDALQIIVGAGGAVAGVLIAWLGSRRGEVSVKLTEENGKSLEVTAKGVKGLDQDKIRSLTRHVAEVLGTTNSGKTLETTDSGDAPRPTDGAKALETTDGGNALGTADGGE
jgi:hypothetical protein